MDSSTASCNQNKGWYFNTGVDTDGDPDTNDTIFFPGAGSRNFNYGGKLISGCGYYWAAIPVTYYSGSVQEVGHLLGFAADAQSVRPVKEPTQQ